MPDFSSPANTNSVFTTRLTNYKIVELSFEFGKETQTDVQHRLRHWTQVELQIRDAFAEVDSANFSATCCEKAAGVDSDRIRAVSVNWDKEGLCRFTAWRRVIHMVRGLEWGGRCGGTSAYSDVRSYASLRRNRQMASDDRFWFSLIETSDRWRLGGVGARGRGHLLGHRQCFDTRPTHSTAEILITELWQGVNAYDYTHRGGIRVSAKLALLQLTPQPLNYVLRYKTVCVCTTGARFSKKSYGALTINLWKSPTYKKLRILVR